MWFAVPPILILLSFTCRWVSLPRSPVEFRKAGSKAVDQSYFSCNDCRMETWEDTCGMLMALDSLHRLLAELQTNHPRVHVEEETLWNDQVLLAICGYWQPQFDSHKWEALGPALWIPHAYPKAVNVELCISRASNTIGTEDLQE